MFSIKKTKDNPPEILNPFSQKQQSNYIEINDKNGSSSSLFHTKQIIHKRVTIENGRSETKEVITNYEIKKDNVNPQNFHKNDIFDVNLLASKINSLKLESPLLKTLNHKMEVKKPINTFDQSYLNSSFPTSPANSLTSIINKKTFSSTNQNILSIPPASSATFSTTRPSYLSPYKRPTLLSKDDVKYSSPFNEFKSSTSSSSNSKHQLINSPYLIDKTLGNKKFPNEKSSKIFLKSDNKLLPLVTEKKNLNSNSYKEIPIISNVFSQSKTGPGLLYIFHHDEFKDPNTKFREGSQHDVHLLKKTFAKFKVKTFVHENCTISEIKKIMKKVSSQDLKKNSCIIFAILSHGDRMDKIAAYDGTYSINDDILFQVIKNKYLRGKPKIFIVQACKGSFDIRNFETDNIDAKDNPGVPDEIYKFYSTSEGFAALRNSTGTVFIQEFCLELEKYGDKRNIKEIMESTIQQVKDKTGNKQIPSMCVNNTMPYIFGEHK